MGQAAQVIAKEAERPPLHHKLTPGRFDKEVAPATGKGAQGRHFNLDPDPVAKPIAGGITGLPQTCIATSRGGRDHGNRDRRLRAGRDGRQGQT